MKYRVIGWTNALNPHIEEADNSIATYNVILDDVIKNGYCFTGCSHQNFDNGVPVLNDGKKRTFTEREWGLLMATAQNSDDTFLYSYADFDEVLNEILPPKSLQIDGKAPIIETDICEEFQLNVDEKTFQKALDEQILLQPNLDKYRYLDVDDLMTLCCNDKVQTFSVKDIREGYNTNIDGDEINPIYIDELYKIYPKCDDKKKAQLSQLLKKGIDCIAIYLNK